MPGFVKTARDEEIWQESKRKVEKSKDKSEDSFTDQDWGLVNNIFHLAKKKYKGKSLPMKYHASYLVRAVAVEAKPTDKKYAQEQNKRVLENLKKSREGGGQTKLTKDNLALKTAPEQKATSLLERGLVNVLNKAWEELDKKFHIGIADYKPLLDIEDSQMVKKGGCMIYDADSMPSFLEQDLKDMERHKERISAYYALGVSKSNPYAIFFCTKLDYANHPPLKEWECSPDEEDCMLDRTVNVKDGENALQKLASAFSSMIKAIPIYHIPDDDE